MCMNVYVTLGKSKLHISLDQPKKVPKSAIIAQPLAQNPKKREKIEILIIRNYKNTIYILERIKECHKFTISFVTNKDVIHFKL